METKLTSPQDYVDLYDRMGCVDFMNHYFHMYDDIGVMTRILHWNIPYVVDLYGDKPQYCSNHNKWHLKIVKDTDIQEYITICPEQEDQTDYQVHPRYYAGPKASNGTGFVQPNMYGNDIWIDISQARVFYSSTYLWNPIVLDYKNNGDKFKESNKLDYIVAYIPIMEIDVNGTNQNHRNDMMDKDTFQDFETADGYIIDKLADEFDGEFTKRTSGNGMYYQGEPIKVNNIDELDLVKIGFQDLCYEIQDYFIEGDKFKLNTINFDIERIPGWNKYFKSPFSLHRKFDRISLPLPAYEYLDYDYIETYSNPYNLTEDIVNDIVKAAGY